MSLLSVVIPSWNTRELLRECLASLARAQLGEHEIIVVDNASADGSADMVARDFPAVRLQRNARNEGFAIGCNQGLALARGEWLLLLNADTRVEPDAIALLERFLESHADYGAAAPRLVSPDGGTQRSCQAFPNLCTPLFFATPFERWFPNSRELRRYFLRDWAQEDERDVEQPPAACLLLRRAALAQVGHFDERLWLFYNDVDLSLRLARAGWRTRYVASARVLHHIGASTRQFGTFIPEWHRNRLHYYRKHHGWLAGVWVKACAGFALADFALRQLVARARGRAAEPVGPMLAQYARYLGQ